MSRTADEAFNFLIEKSKELSMLDVCEPILFDKRFLIWTGSSKPNLHHYGQGGLVIHTAEVVELCLMNNQILGAGIPPNELFLAAFFHDVGKMEDYTTVDYINLEFPIDQIDPIHLKEWTIAEHRILIHHITRSVIRWVDISSKLCKVRHMQDRVIHAILAHHGRPEWGSPVVPKTKMAHMLHFCDAISARMNDADKNPIIRPEK
jgi:3'-5' exoribonuclease